MEGAKEDLGRHLRSFSPLRQVAAPGEGICFAVFDAGMIDDGVFMVIDFFGPASLATGEDAGGLDVFEVLVVSDDFERLSQALEIVSPELNSSDYGEELLVVDVVVAFGWQHLAGEERDWVEESVRLDLGEYGGYGVVGVVRLDDGFEGGIKVA